MRSWRNFFNQILTLTGLLLASGFAQAGDTDELRRLLSIDRFHAYATRWSIRMQSTGRSDLARAMAEVTPEEIARLELNPKKLADAFEYDELIRQILSQRDPKLRLTRQDVAWNYDFYKRKLNEAYRVSERGKIPEAFGPAAELDPTLIGPHLGTARPGQVALNVDAYVSERSTRALFWEASLSQRPIEFHVGSQRDFLDRMAARQTEIIGQITTRGRNYNPIYLIRDPEDKTFHYAITEIAGSDRLHHLATQTSLIRWRGEDGKLEARAPAQVYGDPVEKIRTQEVELRRTLQTLPTADHVVIGQKQAFQNTFDLLAKREAIEAFLKSDSDLAKRSLNAEEWKALEQARARSGDRVPGTLKDAKAWEETYEKILPALQRRGLPLAKDFTAFTVSMDGFDFSDYILQGKDGKPQRWRIFSNTWGEEVLPIAKALKATGHHQVSYIGTAGAIPGSDLRVGDLAIPARSLDRFGKKRDLAHGFIPEGAKTGLTVGHVQSPFDETQGWLKEQIGKTQAVEIESGYLASVFNGPKDHFKPYLLISDIVGSTEETLAEATSNRRRGAQVNAISAVLKEGNVQGAFEVTQAPGENLTRAARWMEEISPRRDPASKYQLIQKAHSEEIKSRAAMEKLIESEPAFSTERLERTLHSARSLLGRILGAAETSEISPRLSVSQDFLEGRWNPAREPISVTLHATNARAEIELTAILEKLNQEDPSLKKLLQVKLARGPPPAGMIQLPRGSADLREIYQIGALHFGGLVATENRSGALKFVQVTPHAPPEGRKLQKGALTYFSPDEATAKLLSDFKNTSSAKEILKREIEAMNRLVHQTEPYRIRSSAVAKLPEGSLAQIVPVIEDGKLVIDLKITQAGLKNPAVVLEELIHLQQITGSPLPWAAGKEFKTFVHPYHWAETVANAASGSLQAKEKLARVEYEAALASEDAVKFYKSKGLFGGTDRAAIDAYLEKRTDHADTLYRQVAKDAKADAKVREKGWEKAKEVFDKLEKSPEKLDDLVAKNDRRGVRKLLSEYLPWDLMEPSEKRAWEEWLDAIEKPNKNRSQVVFRGMYDDTVMRNAEREPFLMSTVLTRNQGNYNRRLRSLATLREKFGAQALRDSASSFNLHKENPPSITVMMSNHAIEAKGSPFLSVANYDVATKFGPRQLGAFRIDERRLIPNGLAPDKYLWEQERLVPLIIFPDEVVHFHDYARDPVDGIGDHSPAARKEHFLKGVREKLGRPLRDFEISGKGTDRQFAQNSLERIQSLLLKRENPRPARGACKSCDCLFDVLNQLLR